VFYIFEVSLKPLFDIFITWSVTAQRHRNLTFHVNTIHYARLEAHINAIH
jgi:hypothetical protein